MAEAGHASLAGCHQDEDQVAQHLTGEPPLYRQQDDFITERQSVPPVCCLAGTGHMHD